MTTYLFAKYLHYLAIIGLSGTLIAEFIFVKKMMTRKELAILSRVDAAYGFFAILVVAMGLTLWFGVGKGAEFYQNPVFHLKVGIVVIIGILSIWPTVFFIKNRKGNPLEIVQVPKSIRSILVVEIVLLAFIPLLAVLMAHGLRFF